MKNVIQLLLITFACALALAAQASKPATLAWHDTVRDVLIDGEIDRATQVISCDSPTRLAMLSPKLNKAVVLNIDDKSVNLMAKEAFRFAADKTSATSD